MKKTCSLCGEEKQKSEYYQNRAVKSGLDSKCKDCSASVCRKYRAKNKDRLAEFERKRNTMSITRIKSQRYKSIRDRCSDKPTNLSSMAGTKCLTKEQFDSWWDENVTAFEELYKQWKKAGFEMMMSPSIDRIDNRKGYLPENMQWLTTLENCRKWKS